jgi:hypothetical protein
MYGLVGNSADAAANGMMYEKATTHTRNIPNLFEK